MLKMLSAAWHGILRPTQAFSPRDITRARHYLWAYAVLTLLIGWGCVVGYILSDRNQTLDETRHGLMDIAGGLNIHIEAILADGMGAARTAASQLEAHGGIDAVSAQDAFMAFRIALTGGEYVSALFVSSPDRVIITGRDDFELDARPGAPWLRDAFEKKPALFVGTPIEHPSRRGQRVIPIARRIVSPGMEPVYAGAWFDIEALHQRYASLLPKDGALGLAEEHGRILVRVVSGTMKNKPAPVSTRGNRMFDVAVRLARSDPMIIEGIAPSGHMMFAVSRPDPDAPLISAVGRPWESVVAPWWARTWKVLIVASVVTVLLVLLTMTLHHYVIALDRANRTLEQRVDERTVELLRANAHLAALNEELKDFSAAASHDLRSPLTTISGQAGLLELKLAAADGEEVHVRLERIQSGVKRAVDVIDGMLAMARISHQELQSEEVCLSAVVRQAVDELRQQNPTREVHTLIEDDVAVTADPRLMRSLIGNLISNAWKYSAPQPRVEIEFSRRVDGETATYCITDHGAGFDMAHADHLFRPFRRLHPGTQFSGTGVGLAIVARIVHRYGGAIWAQGEVGKGATFCFTLPLAERRQQAA